MTLIEKTPTEYDPVDHLATSYPTWHVTTADLAGLSHEVICAEVKLIVVDPEAFDGDVDWAFGHAAAHLDEHMSRLNHLTGELCAHADYLAQVRLDRAADRPSG